MTTSRVRLDPDTRREQLLDLGVRLLADRGLDELSIDLLAEEAGISRGLLYHYFRNKQEFHRAVVRRAADELIAVTTPDPKQDVVTQLTGSLEAYVDYVAENHRTYVTLLHRAVGGDEGLRRIVEETRSALANRIFDNLGPLGLTDTPAVRLMAAGWITMAEEIVVRWVPGQQVTRGELLSALVGSLPAVLAAASGDPR